MMFPDPEKFTTAIRQACNNLISAESEITNMDTIAGDGDCGLTLKAGALAVLQKVVDGQIKGIDIVSDVITIAQVAEEKMGGTSGALYSIFFSALAQGLEAASVVLSGEMPGVTNDEIWTTALKSALEKLYTYTLARRPSRTLVDPLDAFVDAFQKSSMDLAVNAAQEAAEATKDMDAKVGRSAYVQGDRLKDQKIPDPGAWGVKIILESLRE
jgi:dihydroxyacetone kinase